MPIFKRRIEKRSIPMGGRVKRGTFVVGGVRVSSPFQKPVERNGETVVRSPVRSPFQRTEESRQRQRQHEAESEQKRQKHMTELGHQVGEERAKARIAEAKGRQRRAKKMGRRRVKGARTWWV